MENIEIKQVMLDKGAFLGASNYTYVEATFTSQPAL